MEQILEALQIRGSRIRSFQHALNLYLPYRRTTDGGDESPVPGRDAAAADGEAAVFEFFLMFGLKCDRGEVTTYVQYKYPPNEDNILLEEFQQIGQLCFPDSKYWSPDLAQLSPLQQSITAAAADPTLAPDADLMGCTTYQLTLVDGGGCSDGGPARSKRKFAYCRRIVPPNSDQVRTNLFSIY